MIRWLTFLPLFLVCTLATADELRTLGGKIVTGQTTKITDAEITLKSDKDITVTPLSQVLALDLRGVQGVLEGSKYTDVRLIDDTVLHCQSVSFLGKEVELGLLSGIKLKLPIAYVSWLLRDAQKAKLQEQWTALLSQKTRADRVVVLREEALNALEGSLGEIDDKAQTIAFRREAFDAAIPIKLDKVHGLVFFRPDPPAETPICRVYDSQGNALTATKLGLDGDSFTLTTTFGAPVRIKTDLVARIDFNMGKLTYLSDLEPARVLERSRLGLVEPYRRDANLEGQPILLDKTYAKGLSMHAHTELEYALAGKYKDFKAVLGVDARVGTNSRAMVTVYLDGEMKFQDAVSGKTRPFALDVQGVNTLRIVVSSQDLFGLGDHATLADARVSQ